MKQRARISYGTLKPVFLLMAGLVTGLGEAPAETVTLNLPLDPPDPIVNNLGMVFTDLAAGSDQQFGDVAGSIEATLEVTFHELTQVATVTGVSFTEAFPGSLAFDDMSFNLGGGTTVDTVDLEGTLSTTGGPGTVSGTSFDPADHNLVLSAGEILPNPHSATDLTTDPITAALASAVGNVYFTLDSTTGNQATYDVVIQLPAQFSEEVADTPSSLTMSGTVTLRATTVYERIIQDVPVLDNAGGATGVSTTTATLHGTLVSTGAAPTRVSMYYGTTDGGTDRGAWETYTDLGSQPEGAVSGPVSGLSPESFYFYRCYGSNTYGEAWADSSASFSTVFDSSAYAHSMEITFPGYQAAEDLVDFPVLVELSEDLGCFRFDQFASMTGADLRFTDESGTRILPYEIERWDPSDSAQVWVRLPALSLTSRIIAWWGHAGATAPTYAAGSVWRSEYNTVMHLDETTGDFSDATANAHTFAALGGVLQGVDGMTDGAAGVDGVDDVLQSVDNNVMPDHLSSASLECWIKTTDNANAHLVSSEGAYVLDYRGGSMRVLFDGSSGGNPTWDVGLDDDQWHYLFAQNDGLITTLYVDGQYAGESLETIINLDAFDRQTGVAGQWDSTGSHFEGTVDEVRMSTWGYWSTNWIAAVHANQAANRTFADYGAVSNPTRPKVDNAAGAANVGTTTATLRGEVTCVGAANPQVIFYYGTTDGGTNKTAWGTSASYGNRAVGAVTHPASGLTGDTAYYYRCYVTNAVGEGWARTTESFTTLTQRPAIDNDGGASQITDATATLRGTLTSLGGAPTQVSVFWGTTDGGTTPGAWDTQVDLGNQSVGSISQGITGLSSETGYLYRYYATNVFGEAWAPASEPFRTSLDFSGFTYSMDITASGYDRGEALANFPMLVALDPSLPGFSYDQFEDPDGGDLRFSSADGSASLSYEIETWDPAGTSYVWVQVPQLAYGTVIKAYWGDAAASAPDFTTDGSTWSQDFEGVWHLSEPDARDASGNDYHGTANNNTNAMGRISGGQGFNGVDAYVDLDAHATGVVFQAPATISYWMKPYKHAISGSYESPYSVTGFEVGGSQLTSGLTDEQITLIRSENAMGYGDATPLWDNANPTWHHVTVLLDGTQSRLIFDGEELPITVRAGNVDSGAYGDGAPTAARIGWSLRFGNTRSYLGLMDEVRVASTVRSTNWAYAAWLNVASNATFQSYGIVTGGSDPVVTNEGGASAITGDSATLHGHIIADGGSTPFTFVFYGTTDGGTDQLAWDANVALGLKPVGTFQTSVSGLMDQTEYHYRCYVLNAFGDSWAGTTETFTTLAERPLVANRPATEVVNTGATLHGTLVEDGVGPTAVSVFYGTSEGGVDPDAWDVRVNLGPTAQGDVSSPVSSLLPNTTYYYQYYASNTYGEAWADNAEVLTTPSDQLEAQDYLYRMEICADHYTRTETLTNFPLRIRFDRDDLTGFSYAQFASPTGGDLRFTAADGTTVLAHEIESWDPDGDSYVWVQVPRLTSGECVVAYWGNPQALTPPPYATDGSVWDDTFEVVWHLNETSGNHADASGNGHTAIPVNNPVQDETGVIDGADRFPAGNDAVGSENPDIIGTLTAASVHGWFRGADTNVFGGMVFSSKGAYAMYYNNDGDGNGVVVPFMDGSSTGNPSFGTNLNDGAWHHFVIQNGGTQTLVYLDGVLDGTWDEPLADLATIPARPTIVGANWNGGINFGGSVDEIRFNSALRSSNWVWACYMNQSHDQALEEYAPVSGGLPDSDGDGIPDYWEELHFGGPTNAVAGADSDGDRFSNLSEYTADTIPTNGASFFMLTEINDKASYTVSFPSSDQRVYSLRYSPDLKAPDWLDVDGQIRQPGSGGIDSLTDTNNTPVRTYRVEVDQP